MSAAVEVIAADVYTHVDFQRDRRAVEKAAHQREVVVERVQAWERTNTIDLARRLVRMRDSEFWYGPGGKHNDREFYEWLVAEIDEIDSSRWAQDLLMAGRALAVLEKNRPGDFLEPVGASQIKSLGSRWYLQRPRELMNVWLASVEETPSGQPSKELVATKARRYKADVESTEKADALPFEARRIHRRLAKIRRQLVELYREDPMPVEVFLRELAVSIRDEARQ